MQTSSDYRDGILTVRYLGELDHYAATEALRAVETAGEEYMPRCCVLDFSQLTFMDSSGIAVILRAERILQQSGAELRIVGCNRQVCRVLELSGLGEMIRDTNDRREECGLH